MADNLYGELKEQLQALSSPLFEFAEQQVRRRNAFLPFGAALTRNGEVALHAASAGEEVTSPSEVLPILHEGLRSSVAEQDLSAVAVCEWVRITPEGRAATDAVKVLVEHERGLTVAFYVPCRRRLLFGWRFGAMFVKPAEPEVKPSWNARAGQQWAR
jgi:hypothetical protein